MKTSLRCALGALTLLAAITACGGEDAPPSTPTPTPPTPPAAAELTLSPAAQTLPAGAAPVTFTAAGGTGTYAWTLAPATGVGALSATQGASVTFTPAPSVSARSTATLTVTSGEQSATVTLTVEPRAIAGRVLAKRSGAPYPGLAVSLANADGTFTTQTTDTEGRFGFPSAPASYTLVVHEPQGAETGRDAYSVYRGLTRADPVLTALGGSTPAGFTDRSASISGAVTGTTAPPGGGFPTIVVSFGAVDLGLWSYPSQESTTGEESYSLSRNALTWPTAASVTGTVHALQLQRSDGVPVSYAGYGKRENVTVTDGATLTGQDVALAPVGASTFSATFEVPSGGLVERHYVDLQYGPHSRVTLLALDRPQGPSSLPVPLVPGAALTLRTSYTTARGSGVHTRVGVPADTANLVLRLTDAPAHTAPAAGATGVTASTTFTWEPVSGATHLVEFLPSTTGPHLFVATTEAQTTLPELSGLGVVLPKAAEYRLRLLTMAPLASVDAYAVPGGGEPNYFRLAAAGVPAEDTWVGTAERRFTTAP